MSDERPIFRVIRPSDGHEFRIYASGRIEGFGDATFVINGIPAHVRVQVGKEVAALHRLNEAVA